MATVFFKINEIQEKEVENLMEKEGYTNKAEFFRFLIKFYKYHKSPDEIRFEKTASELADILRKLNKKGRLQTSLDEQLKDL